MLQTTQPQRFDNMTVDMKKHYIDLKFKDPTNNLRMRYRDSHGKGPPIILLHGGGFTGPINWGKHYEYLSNKFRVISPDHRGHGDTNNPRGTFGTFKQLADDMAVFIKQMGFERPVIMGHSSGAATSLHLSIYYPELLSKQILIGIHPNMGVSEKHKQGLKDVYGNKDYRLPPTKWQLIKHDYRLALWSWTMHSKVNWSELIRTAWPMWAAKWDLSKSDYALVKCPTLVVWGQDEDFGSNEDHQMLQDLIPDAKGIMVARGVDNKKVPHIFVSESPKKLQKVIHDFL